MRDREAIKRVVVESFEGGGRIVCTERWDQIKPG
jgi:hypothetical protein